MNLSAWLATFLLELRLGARSRRFLVFTILFLLPVALAPVTRWLTWQLGLGFDEQDHLTYVDYLFFLLVVPLASLLHGGGVVRDDVEHGTWHYHVLTPLAIWKTLLAKYAAAVVLVWTLALPALVITHAALFLGSDAGVFGTFGLTLRSAGALMLGALAYVAVFAFLGVATKRPLIIGLIYGLASEYALQQLPGQTVVRDFTVIFHVRSIAVAGELRETLEQAPVPASAYLELDDPVRAALVLLAFATTFLVLACVVASRRELIAAKEE